jgi:DNA-binding NarL/FixJ family response regulator
MLLRPEDVNLNAVTRSAYLAREYDLVFATGNHYQAYLFALFHRAMEGSPVVGAGCTEAEVEGLVRSCSRPCGLLVSDCVAGDLGDAGESLVERVKEWSPKTRAVLIASERGEVLLGQGRLEVYDGIVSIHSVHQGGVLRAVEHVLGGKGRYRDPALRPKRSSDEAVVQLSGRERQVLSLLAKGKTNKEIAAAIFIAEVTARDYVSGIYRKTGSANRAEAAAWAVKHGY